MKKYIDFYLLYISKMFTQLKNVIVEKISLVTSNENPAVPKANTKFALFKTAKNPTVEKLEKIIKDLSSEKKLQDVISSIS